MKVNTPLNLRHLSSLSLALAMMTSVHAQSGDFIRQTQLDDSGLIRDYYVPTDEGRAPSVLPISLNGSEFSLYAQGIGSDDKTYFLDSKIVGAYLPRADVNIITEDPYPILRTRADRPFIVELTASGMVPITSNAANHQKEVYFQSIYEEYDRETHASPADIDTIQVVTEAFYLSNTNNGPMTRTQTTRLPVGDDGDPTKVEGEEVYTIFSISSDIVPAFSVLDSETIQIWPLADGKIIVGDDQVMENGETIRVLRDVPPIRWEANDLYPDSYTYLQIYPGEQKDGTQGTLIENTDAYFYQSVPVDDGRNVQSWDDEAYTPQDGIYTIELLTVTPFNDRAPEILAWFQVEVDRTIKVRAHVGGSE